MDSLAEQIGTDFKITIKDQELTVRPVTLATWAELEQFIREQNIKAAHVIEDRKERQEVILSILNSDINVNEALNRVDVSIHFVWLCLKNNDGMTKEKVVELLSGENIGDIADQVLTMSMNKSENPTKPTAKKAKS